MTPHPKQLKARHPQLFKEKGSNVDGHVIPHNPERDVNKAFVPGRDDEVNWTPDVHDLQKPVPGQFSINSYDFFLMCCIQCAANAFLLSIHVGLGCDV